MAKPAIEQSCMPFLPKQRLSGEVRVKIEVVGREMAKAERIP
ncbi:hypothetical protein CA54_29120 [Symmachiella macrocystis]|uniref:Uncharacterized protein n=1 Tax=Symmachiella macrocystis TaxID=2527985 RepID=A0A5C6BPE1_9PLAN|nr:hypothetical protein [Symmachiella macrocystis]TWU14070.1 hypothetical protein CA54_29120 [Symmachiella macrocystis]